MRCGGVSCEGHQHICESGLVSDIKLDRYEEKAEKFGFGPGVCLVRLRLESLAEAVAWVAETLHPPPCAFA